MDLASLWTALRSYFGYNDWLLSLVGSNLVVGTVFWSLNAVLLTFDLTGKPKWILKYKVQQDQEIPIDKAKLWKAVKRVLFNEFVITIPLGMFYCSVQQMVGCPTSTEDLPSIGRALFDLFCSAMITEIGFYYAHRFFHYGPLYKYFHKTHHEWTAPVGVTAMYCHPLEQVIANVSPVALGPIILRSHIFTSFLWYGTAIFFTTMDHSGYHFPFWHTPEFHDYHHWKFNENFGAMGWMDYIHGTSKKYRQTIQCKRRQLLLGLKPIHELIPDSKQG